MSRAAPLYAALDRLGVLAAFRAVRPGDVVLCYHNVLAAGATAEGDASLHLTRDAFEAQLDWLRERFELVPAERLATEPAGRRPRAAITFDDAYRGVVRHALPALRARGIPSTIFVASGYTDAPRHFWWDVVAALRPAEDRVSLRDRYAGEGGAIQGALGIDRIPDLGDDYLPCDWAMLRAAMDADLSIGSHSVSHPMLSRIAPDALAIELTESRARIAERLGVSVTSLAYPYGAASVAVARAAERAGYATAFTVVGGRVPHGADAQLLPRFNIPASMPRSAFAAAVSGLRLGGGA